MLDNSHSLTVTDLKQFSYCARVIFYERCLPHIRPRTYKMDAGREAHEDEEKRAVRRTLSKYEVEEGERFFNIKLASPTLQLTGSLDEVVRTADGEIFPVDYKLAKKVSTNHRLQLAAYGLLLEDAEKIIVSRGFVYLILTRQMVEIPLTDELKQQVRNSLEAMQTMITAELMPPPVSMPSRCMGCEFRRFCNDV